MQAFLDMGGYAGFVWPAYAVVAVVMAALVIASVNDLKRQRRLLAALEPGEGKRKRAAARDGASSASSGA
ncbi:MAG TPA: heme exporter protein CcmD [Parvibaculum sp.]